MAALRCQHCNQPLTAAEIQAGWCENCGKRVASGIVSAAAHGTAELAPPRQASVSEVAVARSKALLGWGTVRAGLAQVFVGVLLLALGLGIMFFMTLDTKTAGGKGPGTGKQVLLFVTTLMLGIGRYLAAAGMCMGCAAPGDPGPKGWAVGVAACVALVLLVVILQFTFQVENERVAQENYARILKSSKPGEQPRPKEAPYGEGAMKALRYTLEGAIWLGGILFVAFLGGVAAAFKNTTQAIHAVVFLVVGLVAGSLFIGYRLATTSGSVSLETLETLERVRLGAFTVLAVWSLVLIGLIRGTVTRGLAR